MKDITDYVNFIALSMGVELDEMQLNKIGRWLISSEKYSDMLNELEQVIMIERDDKIVN